MTPRRASAAEAIERVAALCARPGGATLWVGIDGCGAAGKSTLARRIAAAVPGCVLVAVDDFSGPRVAEWDWDRFRAQVLLPLLAGRAARYQRWDWDLDAGAEWHDIEPGRVVLVEGVSSTRQEVGAPWTLRIWVETPPEVRLARALERDGPAMRSIWLQRWMPSEDAYVARERPQERVDLVVSGAG